MKKKNLVSPAANSPHRKAYLKTGIAVIITVVICGWVVYGFLNPKITVNYNDFAIDSAIYWLENADRQDFNSCRKDAVDSDGWFNWFVTDRKSLGKVKLRNLAVRQGMPDTAAGMKRYELKFGSKFSKSSQNGEVTERMIIETDGHSRFKVCLADFWFSNGVEFVEHPVSESDKAQIMAAAGDFLKKMAAKDVAFFKKRYSELAEQPDYFNWNQFLVREAKNPTIISLPETSSEMKFVKLGTYVPVGSTGFECSSVEYRYSISPAAEKGPSHKQEIALATAAAEKWLPLVDDGKCPESWKEAATYLKNAITAATWEQSLKSTHTPFGKPLSRNVKSAVYYTNPPGAPAGRYVVIQFETAYDNNKIAIETVTPMADTDGQWRVCGYNIQETKISKDNKSNNKSQNFMLRIYVDRDLYQNKSAPWIFNAFSFWEEK